jgi:hypothetical protein
MAAMSLVAIRSQRETSASMASLSASRTTSLTSAEVSA